MAHGQEASPPAGGVRIRITAPQPLNGRGEWQPPEGEDGFLSTTPVVCQAEVEGADAAVPIRWRAAVYRGDRIVGTLTGIGPTFTFRPADAARRQSHGPLAVELVAEAGANCGLRGPEGTPDCGLSDKGERAGSRAFVRNPQSTARVRIQQDEIDQLRQEYLDLPGRDVALAPRRAFISQSTYEQLGALTFPWPDLNRTRRPDGGCYGYILVTDALREGLQRWQEQLGARPLTITSGFRNPIKQRLVNGSAPGSMHQYGRAVDVQASLRRDFRDWVQVAWAALDARADYVETAPEGGWNHVHADWRRDGAGPPLTVKLEVAGRVLDGEGNPVPAARILGTSDAAGGLPGMPAWEGPDADGQFLLRTVWRPGRPYRLRAQTENASAAHAVTIPEGATGLIRLETDLVLVPDPIRAALTRRPTTRLASRGARRHRLSRRISTRRTRRHGGRTGR